MVSTVLIIMLISISILSPLCSGFIKRLTILKLVTSYYMRPNLKIGYSLNLRWLTFNGSLEIIFH